MNKQPQEETTPREQVDENLSSSETLHLFSRLLDSKLNQKFSELKHGLEEKDSFAHSQLKKFRSDAKTFSSFQFKGNRLHLNLTVASWIL